jgi:hypothetical protein
VSVDFPVYPPVPVDLSVYPLVPVDLSVHPLITKFQKQISRCGTFRVPNYVSCLTSVANYVELSTAREATSCAATR